ncbi:MAG: hypothetical protein HC842_00455 [Cytophagales bacterium]|nr:hypothetical protein [Cytophagales bacterium]
MHRPLFLLFVLWLCQLSPALGQRIKPQGLFLQDSVMIGQEVAYSLSVRYPSDFVVLFPDSTHTFGAFEWVRKDFFLRAAIAA